uniref:Transmembrane ion channel n=1 Tax=Pristionchus pacificus TaxID=54126 RepID=A0A2A6CYS6_PRIPA|eukprot:PDM83256.1 transmembrane ion channel [Pristionchus pacificus]
MIYRLILVSILLALVDASKEEGELIETLIGNYSTLVRPVPDPALPLTVYIKVHLQQIITLDMKDQTMEMNAWIRYEWNDYQLRWNPEDFGLQFKLKSGNITSIRVDITWFPFDEQLCYMHFSSWTYHRGAIDLQLGSSRDHKPAMDISTFVKNGQWHLVNAPSYREETVYTCCPEVYPFVRFYVHLRRRTLFYIFNVIIPSIIITLMTLITFILPPHDMSEKIGHQTTVVLSVSFFLTVISEMIPRTSESVPLLGIFFCTVTCIVSSSAAFTIMVLNMRYRQPGNHFFSASFRRVFCEFLPWLMMMKRPGHKFRKGKANKDKPSEVICVKCTDDYANIIDATGNGSGPEKAEKTKSLFHVLARVPAARLSLERKVGQGIFHRDGSVKSIKELQRDKFVSKTYNEIKNAKDEPTMVGFSILEAYMAISRKVEYLRSIHKKKKIRQHLQEEWKFAAMVFDRFLLFIFTVQITVSVMGLIYFAPYFDAV